MKFQYLAFIRWKARFVIRGLLFLFVLSAPVQAEEVRVAVAANFLVSLKEISALFEQETGHKVLISSGSTGKLYAQVTNGAPFDVFLSADVQHPKLLEDGGFIVPGSRFVYAVGRLTLWSPDPDRVKNSGVETLRAKNFRHLALANPKIAPYGKAALQVLQGLGIWDELVPLIVQGEDIGQTFQFVTTQNAELGFVALSQILASNNTKKGSRWDVPANLYEPINQEAALLKLGQKNRAALALLEYLRGTKAGKIIERAGYGLK